MKNMKQKDIDTINTLREYGLNIGDISRITGWSTSTVKRVASGKHDEYKHYLQTHKEATKARTAATMPEIVCKIATPVPENNDCPCRQESLKSTPYGVACCAVILEDVLKSLQALLDELGVTKQ